MHEKHAERRQQVFEAVVTALKENVSKDVQPDEVVEGLLLAMQAISGHRVTADVIRYSFDIGQAK